MADDRPHVNSASPFEELFGFCRARRVGNRIYVAGTAPIGAAGETVGIGDPAAQAARCFDVIESAVEALGGALTDVVRTRMFLTHIDDWEAIGRAHGEYFGSIQPVSTMVAVARLIDPDWRVEVEAEAVLAD